MGREDRKSTEKTNKPSSHSRGKKGQGIRERYEKAREFENGIKLREERLEQTGK